MVGLVGWGEFVWGFHWQGAGVNRTNCAIVSFSANVVSEKKSQYNVAKIRSQWCSSGNILSLPRKLTWGSIVTCFATVMIIKACIWFRYYELKHMPISQFVDNLKNKKKIP